MGTRKERREEQESNKLRKQASDISHLPN